MNQMMGKQSIQFGEAVHILSGAAIAGKKEGEGPLGKYFDMVGEDAMFGCKSWEEAESTLQKEAAQLALGKAKVEKWQIRTLFAGDLLAQSIASSFGIMDLEIPLYGLYGACSTMGEALSLGSMAVAGGYAEYAMALTSSHFASAEKEFRFPLGYGSQRPLSASWTVTGSGACVLGRKGGKARITGITTGKIVDYGLKDSQNMGACMAPAACDTIYQNFMDFNRSPNDYDRIITGDLGKVGQKILFDLMSEKGFDIKEQHMDCGCLIFDDATQDTHAGGSGCGCAAVTFAAYILPKIESGVWKRVLFVPTGALMSKVSFNEGQSVPGIAHAVVVEHC
ncbi:MAG: stage V sporulation protein AD [Lachnospiraceae bacterium]|jgi:stage V sporulation protein AD